MDTLYIPQVAKVRINLEASEIDAEYESKIRRKLKDKYGDTCYRDGYVKRSSIEVTSIDNGRRSGSHLTGVMTFRVEFKALYCVPTRGKIIRARIDTVNKFGAMATAHPMRVIVPRQIQQYEDIDVFKTLKKGDYVNVQTMDYSIKDDNLIVVGIIKELSIDKPNFIELPKDVLVTDKYNVHLTHSEEPPMINTDYGDNEALNNLKDKITPYEKAWTARIRFMINPYELVDNYRRPDKAEKRYNVPIIKYLDPSKPIPKYSIDRGLYPIFSRAYFKLWEVIHEMGILEDYQNKAITVANVAEGPGGFIHSLIDYRNQQHNVEWKQDQYHGITLKSQSGAKTLDWSYPPAEKYFKYAGQTGYKINLSYGGDDTGDLLNVDNIDHFVNNDLGANKCELVTADGGIELEGDEAYSVQEIANAKLFFAEILTALSVQKEGGTFILKIYDIYYDVTVQMIQLLSIYYDQLTLIKPRTSRAANSEKYLVCRSFNGIEGSELDKLFQLFNEWLKVETNLDYLQNTSFVHDLFAFLTKTDSSEFMGGIVEFNEFNITQQMEKITEGLNLISTDDMNKKGTIMTYKDVQREIGEKWCEEFNVPYVKNQKLTELPVLKVSSDKGGILMTNRMKDRLSHLQKLYSPTGKVGGMLDVGAGNAEITYVIGDKFNVDNVYAADVYSPSEFKQPISTSNIKYLQVVDNKIALPDNSVDLITCFVSIHHFEQFDEMMKEIVRVLKPDGSLFIREHDVAPGNQKLISYLDAKHEQYDDHPGGPIFYWSRSDLNNELTQKYGFEHVGDSDYPKSSKNPQALYHSLYVLKK
jgi:DNA-directed RNA polymerase subunit E'/Rpb7/SAM-dependent methyltransferase